MTKARVAAARIGFILGAFALAWPAAAVAREILSLADMSEPSAGAVARPASPVSPLMETRPRRVDFLGESASNDTRRVADWVMTSGDNGDQPFIIIDKIQAKVFVFNRTGRLLGAAPALLGKAHSDDTVPGIGSKKLSAIRPNERTTPAGRFVATLGHDLAKDILWIDYKDALSLHRVIRGTPGDHRAERLATPSPLDNRISFGCVNVPVKFYEQVVRKAFTGTSGIVYILPEIKSVEDVFPISQAASRALESAAEQSRQDAAEERAHLLGGERGLHDGPQAQQRP